MAEFGFTEEHEMFRRTIRDFARKELAPGSKERQKQETLPREYFKKLADLGLFGLGVPEELGGRGDYIMLGIATEELAKVDFNVATLPTQETGDVVIISHAHKDIRDEWIPGILKGEKWLCGAITEPNAGSDIAGMEARAVRDGDYYILTGEKANLTYGTLADAAYVFAKTKPEARAHGISCFFLPLDTPGVTILPLKDTGWKSTGRASLFLDDVRIPKEYLIGEENEAFYIIMRQMDYCRILVAMLALGAATASIEEATTYAKERIAFGQPIGKFEGISFLIAEHSTMIDAAKLLCYRALWVADQGLPHAKEAAMAKWYGSVVAFNAIHDALLIHGSVGYSEDYPIEQRLRDALGCEIGDGPRQIMDIIILREIMGREFLPY
jgi:cyclohexanecarboxyl-CoA dehydrogenase